LICDSRALIIGPPLGYRSVGLALAESSVEAVFLSQKMLERWWKNQSKSGAAVNAGF